MTEACKNLVQSTDLWDAYCHKNDEPIVKPLMVIQVPDKITPDKIKEICSEIYEKIPDLERETAFAHVMSGDGDLHLSPYEVSHVEPQDVQRKSDIRILFAKEAISTGWDCPRAEVIFSMRSHKDNTYIAQLIGRMVRTPLAHSVNVEILNSVSCFLPYFDPDTLNNVVKYLTEEGNDDYSGVSRESGREIVTKPIDVSWDESFGVDKVFTGIASRERSHSTSNYIDGAISYAGMLEENDISADYVPDTDVGDSASGEVSGPMIDEKEELTGSRRESAVSADRSDIKEAKKPEVVKTEDEESDADSYAIANAKRRAEVTLSPTITNAFFRQENAEGKIRLI